MLVSTDMSHDARVWKEATSLVQSGHSVTVLAAYSPSLPEEEFRDAVHIVRLTPNSHRQLLQKWMGTSQVSGSADTKPELERQQHGTLSDPVRTIMPGFLRRWFWQARTFLAALRRMRELQPDIIHVHDADRLLFGATAHKLLRKPFVYDSHEYFAGLLVDDTLVWKLHQQWMLLIERMFVRQARAVITVNDAIARRLQNRYRPRRVDVLHNFPNRHPPPADRSRLRAHLPAGLRANPLLLYQGRLTPQRGIETFVATLAHLPKVAGAIVGGGPLEAELKSLAVRSGVAERLTFVPQVPWKELPTYTAGADLGFCLSQDTCENNYLALPNKLFEYLMVGVPVVVSDFPVLRQYVHGEGIGVVVPPSNPQAIAQSVGDLLLSPDRLQAFKHNAQQVSQTKYNWENQEFILAELYRQLAA